jgi:Domain of unknown function (DUF4126)
MEAVVLPAFLGIGLAAATGLRTFLPLLMLALAARYDFFGIALNDETAWLGSNAAIAALTLATIIEIAADKIPLVDHALSAVGTVARPLAGALAAWAVFSDLDPVAAALAGLILGAPTALAVHGAQAATRLASSGATGGLANPLLSVVEDALSAVTAAVAMAAPLLVPLLIGALLYAGFRIFRSNRRGAPP